MRQVNAVDVDAAVRGRQCSVMADIRVPANLAETARRDGDLRGWLAGLPAITADFAGLWSLRVGEPFEPGGQCSWVAPTAGYGRSRPRAARHR
jgi:hypothetical protein